MLGRLGGFGTGNQQVTSVSLPLSFRLREIDGGEWVRRGVYYTSVMAVFVAAVRTSLRGLGLVIGVSCSAFFLACDRVDSVPPEAPQAGAPRDPPPGEGHSGEDPDLEDVAQDHSSEPPPTDLDDEQLREVSERLEYYHSVRDDLRDRLANTVPTDRNAMLLQLQLAEVRVACAAAQSILGESDAALAELDEVFASVPLVLTDQECATRPDASECRIGRRLMENAHSLCAGLLFKTEDHGRCFEELRHALSYTDELESPRYLSQIAAQYYFADDVRRGLAITHLALEHARDSNDLELFASACNLATALYRKAFTSISWTLTEPEAMRSADPRDFVDMTGVGIGRDFKYGMVDSDEDSATFFTMFFTSELYGSNADGAAPTSLEIGELGLELRGYATREELLSNMQIDDYVRSQLESRNFEPAAKYLYGHLIRFAFFADSPAELKPRKPDAHWVTPDEVLAAIDQAPAALVDPITLEAILLFVEGHAFLEHYADGR